MRRPNPYLVGVFIAAMLYGGLEAVAQVPSQMQPSYVGGSGGGQTPAGFVPNWIFYWILGLGTAISTSLGGAIKVLWNKNQEKGNPAGLTDDQMAVMASLKTIVEALKESVDDLVQVAKSDLLTMRDRLDSQTERNERQQDKMLKLAVRSQRAIEAVANLPTPEIEEEIDADLH